MLFLKDIRGIPSDHFNRVLRTVESARHDRERQIPNIQQVREFLEHQVSCKIKERTGKPVTDCHFIYAEGSEIQPPFHHFKWFTTFGT